MSELPQVGDFVRVGADYGRVVDVDSNTRMVKVEKMSQDDVKSLLQLQQQSQTDTEEFGGLIDSILKNGGEIIMSEGFFVVQVEPSGSNVKILRVNEPQSQEQEEPNDEPQEPQETPDNVEDPFQEQSQDEEREGGEGGEGGEESEREREEGEEGEGEEGEGESEEGEGEDGEESKGEIGDEGDSDFGDEGDSDFGDEGDSDFGEDSDDEDPLDKVKKELEKAQKEQEKSKKQAKDDVETILNAFNMDLATIKKSFINAITLKRAIGDTEIFEDDNNNRITRAIDLIFTL